MSQFLQMVVACHDANGEPDVFECEVAVDDGDQYAAAIQAASDAGYGHPMVAADESDRLFRLLKHFGSAREELASDSNAGRSLMQSLTSLLKELVAYRSEEFDGPPDSDLHVSGADTVDWLSEFLGRVKALLGQSGAMEPTEQMACREPGQRGG